MTRRDRAPRGRLALAVSLALAGPTGTAQEPRDEPGPEAFSSEAAAITVDVVVLDGDGNPVTDLVREDFELFEDGRAQAIVGFEARDLTTPRPSAPRGGRVATNVGMAGETGRVMALLVDDLGISPATMEELKPRLARWIRERSVGRDEITIVTTSGDRWWSDAAGRGRDDLVATLESISGKRLDESGSPTWISETEAYAIGVTHFNLEKQVADGDRSRPDTVPGSLSPLEGELQPGASGLNPTLKRVAQRYLEARLCEPNAAPELCFARVQSEALQALERWRRRAETAYAAIRRLSRSLAGAPGRKSILFVSESFIDDRSIDGPYRATLDATQRANTAVYFASAGGLLGSRSFSAARGSRVRREDVAAIDREEGTLRLLGGRNLAEATGGAATSSNDLGAGLERMARESSACYLLGYQPSQAPDGRWHELKVEVHREGVRVRARRRYLAAREGDPPVREEDGRRRAKRERDAGAPRRPIAPALLAGSVRAGLPVRMATYVGRPSGDRATVKLVVEVDNSRVHVNRAREPWRALLDLTVMAARVGEAPLVPVDERLAMSLGPGDVGNGWWMISREIALAPGEWQIRAWVRDLGSGASGLVTGPLSVPDAGQTYLSSLMISDRTLPEKDPAEPPRIVPSAQQRFGTRGDIVCQYEVFNFGGSGIAGLPKLSAGYSLHREGDSRPVVVPPTPIEKAASRAVRRIVLPLRKLRDGRYTISVWVRDGLARRTLIARESFVVARTEAAGSPDDQG